MSKASGQKIRILYLMRIFLSESDESHHLTIADIISKLENLGIKADRKTLYDDIETLRLFGLDILEEKKKTYGYYIAGREFETAELKILADAASSSKFITGKKSLELVGKLEKLTSIHDAKMIRRQIYIIDRAKNVNESIYYNVDTLHEAISEDKKVSFRYFEYNVKKERVYKRGDSDYYVSPSSLIWYDENYYLLGHSDNRETISHYRVDRMSDVKKLSEKRSDLYKDINPADYSKKVFGMFGGKEIKVKLRFNNSLAGTVIDRFGKDDVIMVLDGSEHFTISVDVALSPVFFGWLFQFGELCEVVEPQTLKDELKQKAQEFLHSLER